jgi:hypothetical protein
MEEWYVRRPRISCIIGRSLVLVLFNNAFSATLIIKQTPDFEVIKEKACVPLKEPVVFQFCPAKLNSL